MSRFGVGDHVKIKGGRGDIIKRAKGRVVKVEENFALGETWYRVKLSRPYKVTRGSRITSGMFPEWRLEPT